VALSEDGVGDTWRQCGAVFMHVEGATCVTNEQFNANKTQFNANKTQFNEKKTQLNANKTQFNANKTQFNANKTHGKQNSKIALRIFKYSHLVGRPRL
jgi:hypothetical protein